jgi:hypothetical protein
VLGAGVQEAPSTEHEAPSTYLFENA